MTANRIDRYVVMGVSGSGKSEIGSRLARRLNVGHVEGDQYHPARNIARMAAGIPLDDRDRHDWLLALQSELRSAVLQRQGMVLSCSALKRRYRDVLREADPGLVFIHLTGPRALIAARMRTRVGHYMPPQLLDSQLRDLEPLQRDERAITVDISLPPEQVVDQIMESIGRMA